MMNKTLRAPPKALPKLQYSYGTKIFVTAEEVTNAGVIHSVNTYKAEHGAWPAEYPHGPPQVSSRPHPADHMNLMKGK